MATTGLSIGIVGCGPASVDLAARLARVEGVALAGCVDPDRATAERLAATLSATGATVPAFDDHLELIRATSPGALALASPQQSHYRPAMDALQAGCHLVIASPLSISVQESVDIVNLARARDLQVSFGHHLRFLPPLIRARAMVQGGAIGRLRLVLATFTTVPAEAGRTGGVLAGLGIRLVDALLWSTGLAAETVAAIRSDEPDQAVGATSASIRLADGALASVAISGLGPAESFAIEFLGESGRLRATDRSLTRVNEGGATLELSLPEAVGDLASDFVGSIRGEAPSCCPASGAIDAVRVLEAIARSAAIGQFVGLA